MSNYDKKTVYTTTDADDIKVYHKDENNGSKTAGWIIGGLALLAIGAAAIYLTDIDLTQTAELPEVNVEGGQMPKVDVDVADIDVGSKEVDFRVPTIDITPPKEGPEADDLGDNLDVDVDVDVDADLDED